MDNKRTLKGFTDPLMMFTIEILDKMIGRFYTIAVAERG